MLAGLGVAALGVAAATGVALVMAGAVGAHLRRSIAGSALAPPMFLLAVAVAAGASRLATA